MERSKWIHLENGYYTWKIVGGGSVIAETKTLLNSAKRNVETLLGEVEKNSFISWPSRRALVG